MGMILAIASMCMDDCDIATLEDLASDLALEVIKALRTTSHQRTQQPLSVLVERRAEHGWDGQDDMSIDHSLMENFAQSQSSDMTWLTQLST